MPHFIVNRNIKSNSSVILPWNERETQNLIKEKEKYFSEKKLDEELLEKELIEKELEENLEETDKNEKKKTNSKSKSGTKIQKKDGEK